LRYCRTYKSGGVGAIEAEDLDRRLNLCAAFGGFGVASCGRNGEARSYHTGAPGDGTAGEHCGWSWVWKWV